MEYANDCEYTITFKLNADFKEAKSHAGEVPMIYTYAPDSEYGEEGNMPCVTAQMDDEVIIDFEGFKDGVAFDGGKGEDFPLTLGSHQFIPGFEEQIVDHKTGEEFEIEVTFPEDYQMKELAGQKTTFKISLKEIKTQELPELDDEFIKDISEFETVDEYKADAKKKLEEAAQQKADAQFENYLYEKIIDSLEGEIPQCMFDQKVDREVSEFEARLAQNQMSLDLYFQYTGMDIEDLKATYKDRAEKEVKLRLALESIVAKENIEVEESEVEEGLAKLAENNNISVEDVKRFISIEDYRMDLRVSKAADLIKDSAVVDNSLAEAKKEESAAE